MKIVKLGVDTSNWRREVKCYSCQSVLEIEPNDIKYSCSDGDWHDPPVERLWVVCEACNNEIALREQDIPTLVIAVAKRKSHKR